MTKLRGVAFALLVVGVLAGLVPILGLAGPDEVTVVGTPVAAESSPVAVEREQQAQQKRAAEQRAAERKAAEQRAAAKKAAEKRAAEKRAAEKTKTPGSEAPRGPRIDPEDNLRADSERTRNKLMVGAVAAVLGLIVFSGHRTRRRRKKKRKDQAKGK